MNKILSLLATSVLVGCLFEPKTETKTVEVIREPSQYIGTWKLDDVSYTGGDKGYWRITFNESGTFSISRVDTTNDLKSIYYYGNYTADKYTVDLHATSSKLGIQGVSATIDKHDLISYSFDPKIFNRITISENGPDYLFLTASYTTFYKINY